MTDIFILIYSLQEEIRKYITDKIQEELYALKPKAQKLHLSENPDSWYRIYFREYSQEQNLVYSEIVQLARCSWMSGVRRRPLTAEIWDYFTAKTLESRFSTNETLNTLLCCYLFNYILGIKYLSFYREIISLSDY